MLAMATLDGSSPVCVCVCVCVCVYAACPLSPAPPHLFDWIVSATVPLYPPFLSILVRPSCRYYLLF